jgi:hypothetical protein
MNMHRFLIFLLSFVALAVPTTSWEASTSGNLAINVTPGQAITAVNLSNSTFTGGAASGTVVGAISVTMSPASPAFSGSLSLSGTNASSFQIVGSNLETNGAAPAGTYNINIVATEAGVTGSALAQAETISGTAPPPTGVESPGPSQALFNSPYYTCVRNFYVATGGSDSNSGTSSSAPWRTIAHADTSSRAGGDCINVAPGTYSAFNGALAHGGASASSAGYVVYRCTAMDACTITDAGKAVCAGANCGDVYPNYLIFDGFTFQASSSTTFAAAFQCYNGDTGSANGCHHWIMVNNVISGYGQGGIQVNNSEWHFALHNTIHDNANNPGCDGGAQGSGISFAGEYPIVGYTQTADDIGPTPKLGIYGNVAPNPIHLYVEWNVIYNNRMNCASGASTDGNGIIFDSNDNYPYANRGLIAFNVVFNNGGRNIEVFSSSNAIVANNSTYNGSLDLNDTGTGRQEIELQDSTVGPNLVINNIAYAIVGSGLLANNNAIGFGGTGNEGTANNNVTFCTGTPSGGSCNQTYNGNIPYSCTSNKCQATINWINVGNTLHGTISSPPNGTNFALGAGSAAIGYGQAKNYLPAQAVDAGACYHTLTSCP